jgi:hypothetical protein
MSTSVLYTTSVCIRIFSLPSTTSRVNLSWSVSFGWLTTVSVPFRSSDLLSRRWYSERLWSRHLLWHIVWNLCNRLGVLHRVSRVCTPDGQWRTFQASSMVAYSNIVWSCTLPHKCRASNMGSVSAVEFVNYVPSIVVSENLTSYAARSPYSFWPRRNSRSSVYVPQFRQPRRSYAVTLADETKQELYKLDDDLTECK